MVDFGEIKLPKRDFDAYEYLNEKLYFDVKRLSAKLRGKRIVHINSTENGGGVAEMLQAQVALEKNLGLNSHWYVIHPQAQFFVITKKIHSLLQGANFELDNQDKQFYLDISRKVGEEMDEFLAHSGVDIVVAHDPQPLLIGCCNLTLKVPRILRLHIDLSRPNRAILEFLKPFVEVFEKLVVSRSDYKPSWMPKEKTSVIMPAIDPLSGKNIRMSSDEAWKILTKYGVRRGKPLISQVSRFDPFKDPVGVIKAYKIVKKEIENLQLILAGIIEAPDDPEQIEQLEIVKKNAQGSENIFIFSEIKQLKGVSNDEFVNAVQSASDVVLQKSLKEGFGLTVSESMWKKRAVVGGNVGGIRLQIKNGVNGFLVSSIEETANILVSLLKDEKLREEIGEAAYETVKENFLMPRYVFENLKVYGELLS